MNDAHDHWDDIPNTKILHGDCMQLLKTLPDCSIDAIVTDPPYGMSPDGIARTWADIEEGRKLSGFMGKEWDAAVPCHNFFAECLRVLKHGGHMIAFSSTRTVCALGMAAQQGGFVIRDMIHWCYFSGFPKSHDISKAIDREAGAVREVVGYDEERAKRLGRNTDCTETTFSQVQNMKKKLVDSGFVGIPITKPATEDAQKWAGFGTALKPAVEPALLLRKPLEKGLSIAQNVLKHGTGALNIDACRYAYGDPCWVGPNEVLDYSNQSDENIYASYMKGSGQKYKGEHHNPTKRSVQSNDQGRWPANLYQCPKASRSEREEGLDHLESMSGADVVDRKEGSAGLDNPRAGAGRTARVYGMKRCAKCGKQQVNVSGTCQCKDPIWVDVGEVQGGIKNIHPTVKPIKLMRWCCRLVGGQKRSVILDPFTGSGTTGAAALLEGFDFIGIELTDEYLPIIDGRIEAAKEQYKLENAQLSLF